MALREYDNPRDILSHTLSAAMSSMPSYFDSLLDAFWEELEKLHASPAFVWIQSDRFRVEHYAGILRELFLFTRQCPQSQAALTSGLSGQKRHGVRRFLAHVLSEVGQEEFILRDLESLGYRTDSLVDASPLPSTLGLLAYPAYALSRGEATGPFGQFFFLKFLGTQAGDCHRTMMLTAGVSEGACSYLGKHLEVTSDVERLMESHVRDLILVNGDLKAAIEGVRVAAYHYGQMLLGAIEQAERSPMQPWNSTGTAPIQKPNRSGSRPSSGKSCSDPSMN